MTIYIILSIERLYIFYYLNPTGSDWAGELPRKTWTAAKIVNSTFQWPPAGARLVLILEKRPF